MGSALIRVVVCCSLKAHVAHIEEIVRISVEGLRGILDWVLLPLTFFTSLGDYESDGEEEAIKDLDNEDVESNEEVGIWASFLNQQHTGK